MHLVLIRHAESRHSREKFIAGLSGCPGLTEHGFRQAQMLAERFVNTAEVTDCAVLLASPVQRARQTAEVLMNVLPVNSIQEEIDLCELHLGETDGLT